MSVAAIVTVLVVYRFILVTLVMFIPPRPRTIFVSVISYRDPECVVTINNLFDRAYDPSRVTVGLVQQNKSGEDKDAEPDLRCARPRIRILRYQHYEAKGPTWARAMCVRKLYGNEDFYLQVDAHM